MYVSIYECKCVCVCIYIYIYICTGYFKKNETIILMTCILIFVLLHIISPSVTNL